MNTLLIVAGVVSGVVIIAAGIWFWTKVLMPIVYNFEGENGPDGK